MIYLDTNLVVWLAGQAFEQVSQTVLEMVDHCDDLFISPMVLLELEYLYEIKKINKKPNSVFSHLEKAINLKVCDRSFTDVVSCAMKMKWTRDPFDRIITACAAVENNILLTKDKNIQKYYQHAVW